MEDYIFCLHRGRTPSDKTQIFLQRRHETGQQTRSQEIHIDNSLREVSVDSGPLLDSFGCDCSNGAFPCALGRK